MFIKQLYTGCLSEAAYYIESDGESAIIDPIRDTTEYLKMAAERKTVIRYIFETHFHADFVSGHIDLSRETGAPIIFGPGAKTDFDAHIGTDGEIFKLGKTSIQLMHTPGHTIESSCFLLRDENEKAHAIFTGDTLFVNDVGRPDLSSGNRSSEELAGLLYDTIQTRILPLSDDILVYPAHGAGSSCGKNLGPQTFSTIGEQKRSNYALQPQTKSAFIQAAISGLNSAPVYFAINARLNMQGYESLEEVKEKGLTPLNIEAFKRLMLEDIVVLDTRSTEDFTKGFIPGSIFIGLEGRFAEWAGSLLPFEKPLLLITDPGKEEETVIRLSRVGFNKMLGYLKGGFDVWLGAGEKKDILVNVDAEELAIDIPHDLKLLVVDVRRETEFADGHIEGALNLPLNNMNDILQIARLDENKNIYVHCAGGYRSVIAASILKRQGFNNLHNVLGGWEKIKEEKTIKVQKEVSVLN